MTIKEKINYLSKAYENSLNIVKNADTKANISITIHSLLITIGLSGPLFFGSFGKSSSLIEAIKLQNSFYVLFGLFTFFALIGIITTAFTYFPWVTPEEKEERKREGFLFFEHIKEFNTSQEYIDKLEETSEKQLFHDFGKQTYSVSKLASQKMFLVKVSILFLIINILLCLVVLILSGVIDYRWAVINGGN